MSKGYYTRPVWGGPTGVVGSGYVISFADMDRASKIQAARERSKQLQADAEWVYSELKRIGLVKEQEADT